MDQDSTAEIRIEVVFALPDKQTLKSLHVPFGTTAADAIKRSGILEDHPEIDLNRNKIGIYGKITPGSFVLRNRDRVEIYRPLIADPKEVRRKRAEQGKPMKKGG